MKRLGIAVANVPGGSNSAVAEYAVGCAIVLLRRLTWSDKEIRGSNYVSFRGRMVADNLPGLEGVTAGVMKRGAVLIEASRGGIVNEVALAAHLNSGHLGGAAVNVYTVEPPDTDNPLLALEGDAAHRVIFTPHVAGV